MISKLMICPYFGEPPVWMEKWFANTERMRDHGYEFLFDDDETEFRQRVHDKLGIVCPPMWGTGNIWDFRPALGVLYADEVAGYDWWGTTDFDCVYGRVEKFYPDDLLSSRLDIVTDHWEYLCGPWTLFRNEPKVNECFRLSPVWRNRMESTAGNGWMEREFTATVNEHLDVKYAINHVWEHPEALWMEGDKLLHGDVFHVDPLEIPFYHFRRTKQWPL